MIEVKAEYFALPSRHRNTGTVSFDGNIIGLTPVVEALIASERSARFAEKISLTRLQISGSDVTIGNSRNYGANRPSKDGFQNSDDLWEVIIDADRCVIGGGAFWGCKSLKKVMLSMGGQIIGDYAFHNCVRLESVVLPDSVTSIGKGAFSGCKSLSGFIFPSQLRTIGESAFSGTKLQAAILPSGVSSIGSKAFSSCNWMRYACIPSSINMNRLAGDSFPFMDCDYKRLVIVCNQTDFEVDPASSLGDSTLSFSKGLSHRWMTTPSNAMGVRQLFRSRVISSECRKKAQEIAMSAPVRGELSEPAQDIVNGEPLRKYLKLVSDAEATVLQLTEALALASSTKERVEAASERRKSFDRFKGTVEAEADELRADRERRQHEQKRKDILAGKSLPFLFLNSRPSKDPRDTPEPERPEAPTLQKPGLFNRKKVEAQNAEIEGRYQEALNRYEALMAERVRMIADYDERLAAWEKSRKEIIQRQLDELGAFEASPSTIRVDGSAAVSQELEAAVASADALCEELATRLSEASGLLKLAYSADIVFPKYRNIEAVTTMWEYLETGRCDSLQGPGGAYNLYESEVRSNAIIDKLDVISDQLSVLQANQYALYAAVEGIGARLDSMSDTLDSILRETRATKNSVQNLEAKAATLVKNSSEIAYWSKKNAELTDSLGYLIAFTAL